MKFSEIPEPQQGSVVSHLKETQLWIVQEVRETRDRILGYIFGLNAGGIVAGAAALAQGKSNRQIIWAIWLFGIGLLAAVVRATLDYFATEAMAGSFRKNVRQLYGDEIDWDQFQESRKKYASSQWHYYGLGIASGVLFFGGLLIGFLGAVKK